MSYRASKLDALLQKEISTILTRELSLKHGVFITIPRVKTTNDLRYSHVFVSVFPAKEASYAMKTIAHEQGNILKKLSRKLTIKSLPHISFVYDDTEERADIIEKIFHDLQL